MKINRRATLTLTTTRRTETHVVRRFEKRPECPGCGEAMRPTRNAAIELGIEMREIFRLVEANRLVFTENALRETFVCVGCAVLADNSDPAKAERPEKTCG